jgi:hypothetical protein
MPDPHKYPGTPDGRYFVVKGRLWRMSNPHLAPEHRQVGANTPYAEWYAALLSTGGTA